MLRRLQSKGLPWVTRRKCQFARFCVGRRVTKKVRTAVKGNSVAIDPQKSEIEGVSRKFEIVGIAAKICDRVFRCKHQPHVLITSVFVEIVNAAFI